MKNLTIKTSRPAFTLIELLISIAIVGILSAMMFNNFAKEKDRNAIKGIVHKLQTDLQGIQTNAQSGVQTTGATSLLGYGIAIPTGGATYRVFAEQNNSGRYDVVDPADISLRVVTLPTGVTVSKITGIPASTTVTTYTGLDVLYKTPNGTATITNPGYGALSSAVIYIKSTKLNLCYAITVTAGVGTISQKQLSASC